LVGVTAQETEWVFNDRKEYEKHLKMYNDSLKAYMTDRESIQNNDWIRDGYELTTVDYWNATNPGSYVSWTLYGVRAHLLYVKEWKEPIDENGYYMRREWVGVFKRPTHFPVYQPSKIVYDPIPVLGVDGSMFDSANTIDTLETPIIPTIGDIETTKEVWNSYTAAGHLIYDRTSGSWVTVPNGYVKEFD